MGDRISIQFKDKDGYTSAILNSHWRGPDLVEEAREYIRKLRAETEDKEGMPLERGEADVTMVDFVRHLTQGMSRVDSDLRLATSVDNVDNSDNGHHIIDTGPQSNTSKPEGC